MVEALNVAGCVLLTDAAMLTVATLCGHVKSLGVSYVKRLSDAALCTAADYLWLEALDLSGCSHVTDDGIEVLCLEFAGMVKLDLSACTKLTDDAVDSLIRHALHLRWLKAFNLPAVTAGKLEQLRLANPKLALVTTNEVDPSDGKLKDRIALE